MKPLAAIFFYLLPRLLGPALLWLAACGQYTRAENFSVGTGCAVKFGVHEIVLTGSGSLANPFDTIALVTFTPPSGSANAKTVHAFYDGGNIWRARVYTSETGDWTWTSTCETDPGLNAKSGKFRCVDSKLRGRLLIHPNNARQWMTEDGRWFLNLNDTSYFLLCTHDALGNPVPEADFQDYVKDAVEHGITSFRSLALHGPMPPSSRANGDRHRWDDLFGDRDHTRPNLEPLRFADRRLRWMLDNYPDAYVQFILFPHGKAYAADDSFWAALSTENKRRMMRYVIARYAAYPTIFWLVVNDYFYTIDPSMRSYAKRLETLLGKTFPNADAMAREVGDYFLEHDPWRHPMSTGPARMVPFRFGDEKWATYIHLEHAFDVDAQGYAAHRHFNKPVFLGEDRYEQDYPNRYDPVDMRYFQRRLFWAWLLAGGSANYGGRYWVVHPYRQTGRRPAPSLRDHNITFGQLVGLDSVKFIRDYFSARNLELSDFEPAYDLAKAAVDGTPGQAPHVMRRGHAEFLVYHPHATGDGRKARVQTGTAARLRIDLRQTQGHFDVEWYRAEDGQMKRGEPVPAGDWRELTAPWMGADVVVWLRRADG